MKAHDKWLYETFDDDTAAIFELETVNIITMDEAIFTISETAWRAALKWVLKQRKPYCDVDDKKVVATDSDIIYEELKE